MAFIERILDSYDSAYGMRYASLRYFNASGATKKNGEFHEPETHLCQISWRLPAEKNLMFPCMEMCIQHPMGLPYAITKRVGVGCDSVQFTDDHSVTMGMAEHTSRRLSSLPYLRSREGKQGTYSAARSFVMLSSRAIREKIKPHC
jgi:hypothetical protein